jgi:hypothetical protein
VLLFAARCSVESRGDFARAATARDVLRRMSLLFGVGVQQWWCVCCRGSMLTARDQMHSCLTVSFSGEM